MFINPVSFGARMSYFIIIRRPLGIGKTVDECVEEIKSHLPE